MRKEVRLSGQILAIGLRPIGLKVRTRAFQARNARFKSGMGHFIIKYKMILNVLKVLFVVKQVLLK